MFQYNATYSSQCFALYYTFTHSLKHRHSPSKLLLFISTSSQLACIAATGLHSLTHSLTHTHSLTLTISLTYSSLTISHTHSLSHSLTLSHSSFPIPYSLHHFLTTSLPHCITASLVHLTPIPPILLILLFYC